MFLFAKNIQGNILQARRMCKKLHAKHSLTSYYLTKKILRDFRLPDHKNVQKNANKLILAGDYSGYFYLAESYLLQNNLTLSKKYISIFLEQHPHHPDASYILAQIEVFSNQKYQAKQRLLELLQHSSRKKTWQMLSDLVETTMDFDAYEKVFRTYHPHYENQKLPYDLICHLSNAAQRGDCDDFALKLWQKQLDLKGEKQKVDSITPKSSRHYTDKSAAIALSTLKQYLDQANISFFLISGTLLGCIREGKLLSHDKDIDVGVWDTYTIDELVSIIRNSGCFYVLPNYSRDILVIRHVNGITIDIFIHYRESNDYWHAGGKSSWHNSPFELMYYNFLGDQYLIPENYGLYLTENYGSDWRTPKIDFDSTLDTPNMRIVSHKKMLIYFYKKIFALSGKISSNTMFRIKSKISTLQTQDMG